jgi:hypothetical protein
VTALSGHGRDASGDEEQGQSTEDDDVEHPESCPHMGGACPLRSCARRNTGARIDLRPSPRGRCVKPRNRFIDLSSSGIPDCSHVLPLGAPPPPQQPPRFGWPIRRSC